MMVIASCWLQHDSIKNRPGPPGPPGPSQFPLDLHEIPGVRLDHLPIKILKACQSHEAQ